MIDENTPDKLAEIIRDTWPNLFHLNRVGDKIQHTSEELHNEEQN